MIKNIIDETDSIGELFKKAARQLKKDWTLAYAQTRFQPKLNRQFFDMIFQKFEDKFKSSLTMGHATEEPGPPDANILHPVLASF